MTKTDMQTDIPTTGDLVDYHRDLAVFHGSRASEHLEHLAGIPAGERRDTLLNQQIGVNLKLADVHARLALAIAHTIQSSYTPPSPRRYMDNSEHFRTFGGGE